MKANWKYVIEPRDYGFAIVKYDLNSKLGYGYLVAMFKPQPDGTIIRTMSYKGLSKLTFPDLDTVKEWYGLD